MPAVNFSVQWPDGELSVYYSPSTIVYDYFTPGGEYSLEDFKQQCVAALEAAAERVKSRFGYYCTAASAEQKKIEEKYQDLKTHNFEGAVIVISMQSETAC